MAVEHEGSLSQEVLYGIPGISELGTSGTSSSANRGGHTMDGIPYVVNGDGLFRVNEVVGFTITYALQRLGDITGTGRVSMADNGTQLIILVPGGDGYIYNHVSNVFVQITDIDFTANGNPQMVAFIDGYFCCTTDTKKFIVSDLNDGTSWSALDFGSAETDPDVIVAPIVLNNQLFIAGSSTIEAFQNQGGAGFPFQRNGLYLAKGVSAPFSLIVFQTTFMFVGGGVNESPAIWTFAGNSVQKISTRAIDNVLASLTKVQVAGIYAWTYAQNGSYFIGFALPDSTFVYDMTSQKWHERKSYIDEAQGRYRISSIMQAYNRVIASDYYDGRIGELDPNLYTEYTNTIIRTVATQPFQNNMLSFFVPSLELTVESGVGNADSLDPVMMMERSLDGKTWSDGRTRAIGRMGEYRRRAIWRRNGRAARFEIFRFTLSDPVKPVIIMLTANIIGGDK